MCPSGKFSSELLRKTENRKNYHLKCLRCAEGPPTPRTGPCKPAETLDKFAGMPLPTARPSPKKYKFSDKIPLICL